MLRESVIEVDTIQGKTVRNMTKVKTLFGEHHG